MTPKPLTILVAGPYRSGTGDNPRLMRQNLARLESAALKLFRAGHIPLIGEWLALPLLKTAGSKVSGDAIYQEISYPIAHRLITKCDAVLRLTGPSAGADKDVQVALALGLPIYYAIEEIIGA